MTKRHFLFVPTILALNAHTLFAQQPGSRPITAALPRLPLLNDAPDSSTLTRFDLDFPGGTPAELVASIQKSMGRPLNAVIPQQSANIQLPSLKMTHVDAAELFRAMKIASAQSQAVVTGETIGAGGRAMRNYEYENTSCGFEAVPPLTDDSVWYFSALGPALRPAETYSSRFFALDEFLDRGLTVDDITTAIHTAWKMESDSGDKTPEPKLSFHKETKLLIAVGAEYKIDVVEQVLTALGGLQQDSGGFSASRPSIKRMQDQLDTTRKELEILKDALRLSPAPQPSPTPPGKL